MSEPVGDQRATAAKIAARYDSVAEGEVIGWVKELAGLELKKGAKNVEHGLRNGVALVTLAQKVQEGTPECPEKARKMRLKANTLNAPFKQMENINMFLSFCEAYGVPKTCSFQTVDLFEGRNMAQVLSGIQALGTEAKRNGYNGTAIGADPAPRTRCGMSLDKLRASHGIVGAQSGSNAYASQKGMTAIGAVRHGRDIKADKSVDERCSGLSSQQLGSNQFASQKGMKGGMGAIRHVSDIRADDFDPAGANVTNPQCGSNEYASQKGMRAIGGVRHGGDIRSDDVNKEGEGMLPKQSGTNEYATQKGMRIGSLRHGADLQLERSCDEGHAILTCQAGSNKYASQKGMCPIGAVRHIGDISADQYDQASHGIVGQQAGDMGFASQSGCTGFGSVRHGADLPTTNQCEFSAYYIPSQSGSNRFATQKGVRIGGVRHGADNAPQDLLTEAIKLGEEWGWDQD